jgi:Lamin Tail Domain
MNFQARAYNYYTIPTQWKTNTKKYLRFFLCKSKVYIMNIFNKVLGYISAMLLITAPLLSVSALAQSAAGVLINEIQTESSADSNEEFVELVNVSSATIDIEGWKIQYRAATGTSWTTKATLAGQIFVNGSVVVSTIGYLPDNSTFHWSGSGGQLASAGGNIRLLRIDGVTVEDALSWGNGIYGESPAVAMAPKGSTLSRKVVASVVQDTDNNQSDFEAIAASPRNQNVAPFVEVAPVVVAPVALPPTVVVQPVQSPAPTTIVELPIPLEVPLEPPVITPLPEPAPVVTPTVIPDPVPMDVPPVVVPDPSPIVPTPVIPPVLVGEPAQPVVEPVSVTPNAPAPTPLVLSPFIISELMINPSAPATDSSDEWIELYNPNPNAFVLRGYVLQTGTSHSYSYVFTDQIIEPYDYLVLYSSVSNLALSNTSGAVRALDANSVEYGAAVSYEDVEEGNTYMRGSDGAWSWTTVPSPAAANTLLSPTDSTKSPLANVPKKPASAAKSSATTVPKSAAAAKSSSASTAVPKVTAVKAATTKAAASTPAKKPSTKAAVSASASKISTVDAKPTRPWILASFGVLAVLYGVYEYRGDMAYNLQKLRGYLAARAKARRALQGR